MKPASTGHPVILRIGAVAFAFSMMGGFVWYSHVRAQPQAGVQAVGEPTPATILPGSKRANVTVTPNDIRPREDGTIDLNLESAAGDSGTPLKAGERAILPSSKLGVFRDVVSSPGSAPASATGGQPVPPPLPAQADASPQPPPQPAPVILFSGSKTFAGPVITAPSGILTIGKGSKEGASLSLPAEVASKQAPPPSRVMMAGSKSMSTPSVNPEIIRKLTEKGALPPVKFHDGNTPDPAWNQNAPIFTSSKSGTIFRPEPPSPPAAAQTQAPVPNAPPAAAKTEKPVIQPQAETSAPASP
ncbi:hypothetical protein DES53_11965 [Roseimicrobium gellanilyticum]|uniref:Uncharacterized protein n=1 Tax=Roseimicrobium gellanilyticum TaxID=748857 RepID=A0A366H2W1_9BACT|nr:hypothetical protein [Roseimicrobium gellanilyticum]RBP35899.1 hypothetical protein DES53_11965 [Roseimicrobium gellanilyticum]